MAGVRRCLSFSLNRTCKLAPGLISVVSMRPKVQCTGRDTMAGLWLFGTMVAAIALVNGCESAREHSLTYKLWHNEELRHLSQPAVDPKLSLFAVVGQTEILVEYDEDSDSKNAVSRRAYSRPNPPLAKRR